MPWLSDIRVFVAARELDWSTTAAKVAAQYPQWQGFGLALQAYQTRAPELAAHVAFVAGGGLTGAAGATLPTVAAVPDVVIPLSVIPNEMKYAVTEITVQPGQLVEIVFTNPDRSTRPGKPNKPSVQFRTALKATNGANRNGTGSACGAA